MNDQKEGQSEYGNPSAGGSHMDPRHRGLDGRDGSMIGGMSDSLPSVSFDSKIKSLGTISADDSPIGPVRSEGKADTGSLGG